MIKKLLTITIPAYNAEKYLGTCLDSLCIPELIEVLDIIIVNDGSMDNTKELAERYVSEYPSSIRLVNKENGGHGSGINRGIKEASGLYFKVIDADDWANLEGLSELIDFIKLYNDSSNAPDLISTGFLWAFDNGSDDIQSFNTKAQYEVPFKKICYKYIYPINDIIEKTYIKFHNLTIRTNFLRNHRITMDEHVYYEDTEYALYPVLYAKTIAFTKGPLYMYRIGNSGQSMSKEKLLNNASNYDIVLHSLLKAYKSATVSQEVKHYTEHFIARVVAGRIKISLLMPISLDVQKKIRQDDSELLNKYPEIYHANINTAVTILRKTAYIAYLPAALLIRFRGVI